MSLLDTLYDLASGQYTVTRTARPTLSQGEATPGATSTLLITAGIQPTGSDTEFQPEGARSVASETLYTDTQLHTDDDGSAFLADVVSYNGSDYKVVDAHRWQDPDGVVIWVCRIAGIRK